jgi:hypothetical protein
MEGLATTREVSDYLKVKPNTLDRWASDGTGPRFTKVNGRRRYRWSDIRAYAGEQGQAGQPQYTCRTCRREVTSGGHLVVDMGQVARVERASEEFDAYLASKPFPVIEGDDWNRMPDLASWGVFHHACDPAPERNGYFIEIERVATWPALVRLIGHLAEKKWLKHTDLAALLRSIAGE